MSLEWQPTIDDIVMQSDMTLMSGPQYTPDTGHIRSSPWSHLNAAIADPPANDNVLLVADPEASHMTLMSGSQYAPDTGHISSLPWSHLDAAIGDPPASDNVLFVADPGASQTNPTSSLSGTQNTHGTRRESVLIPRSESWKSYREPQQSPSSDSVESPCEDNPVESPDEEVSVRGSLGADRVQSTARPGRRHSLNPEQREHAALVRKKGSCWNCILLKYQVRKLSTNLSSRSQQDSVT